MEDQDEEDTLLITPIKVTAIQEQIKKQVRSEEEYR